MRYRVLRQLWYLFLSVFLTFLPCSTEARPLLEQQQEVVSPPENTSARDPDQAEANQEIPPTALKRQIILSKVMFQPASASGEEGRFAAFFEARDPTVGQGLFFGSSSMSKPGFSSGPGFSSEQGTMLGALFGKRADFWFQPTPMRNVVFAGFEATDRDRYFSTGFKRAITGHLGQPGFRFMATFGAKIRDYHPALGINANRLHASRMAVGYEWHIAALSVAVMAGGSFVLNSTDAVQKTQRLGRAGPFGMVELWQDWGRPKSMAGSRYTSLFVMVDQASRSSHIRLRHGFQWVSQPWQIGPEASYSTGESQYRRGVAVQSAWRKARLGAHISEIPLWQARLAVSGGAESRHDRKTGGYMQISAYLK